MDDFITRHEHEEFARRMEDEHKRISTRVTSLEGIVRDINELTVSVKELAVNMKSMLEEQKSQGDRLDILESKDGEMWRKVTGHAITVIIGIIVGYIFNQIGM